MSSSDADVFDKPITSKCVDLYIYHKLLNSKPAIIEETYDQTDFSPWSCPVCLLSTLCA